MPVKFQRTFRVRHYECDAYGHLNNVNYVRYMQEAALDATAAVGWDMPRYEAIGQMWLIRETDIEYLSQLSYNDEVEITTWVADFRRVQSRRMYEFHNKATGELVARASTNWVYLDTETQRPTRIPPEMIAAFMPEGVPETQPPRDKFPDAATQPEEVYTLPKRVEWRDIDTVGHVNNAAYFTYCEDVSTQVTRHFGWSMQRMQAMGFAVIMRRYRMLYLQPAFLDDDVDVSCWLSDVKRATILRHYELRRPSDAALLARGRGLWVAFDIERQRPIRIPEEIKRDFATNISPD